tara:strand:- start:1646 stop:1954 length:309 start_codon:yes stop_codon:yes gene_type:complete
MEPKPINHYQASILKEKYNFNQLHKQQKKWKIFRIIKDGCAFLLLLFGVYFLIWIVKNEVSLFSSLNSKSNLGAVISNDTGGCQRDPLKKPRNTQGGNTTWI